MVQADLLPWITISSSTAPGSSVDAPPANSRMCGAWAAAAVAAAAAPLPAPRPSSTRRPASISAITGTQAAEAMAGRPRAEAVSFAM